jgi:predicted  nucleic acid-binding Zn-ribbon protein
MKHFKALQDCTDNLQPIKDIEHQYRDNNLIVELCQSVRNVVDEAYQFAREREIELDNEKDELETQISSLEGDISDLEDKITSHESLLDDIDNAETLEEVKALIKKGI